MIHYIDKHSGIPQLTLNPGDQLLFERGGVWEVEDNNSKLILQGEGTLQEPIFVGAYGSGDLPHLKIANPYNAAIIHDEDQSPLSNIIVQDLHVSDANGTMAIKLTDCHNVTLINIVVNNCVVGEGNWTCGLLVRNAFNINVISCQFSYIQGEGCYIGQAGLLEEWTQASIKNCTFYKCAGEAINTKTNSRQCIIENCNAYDNAYLLDNSQFTLSGVGHKITGNTIVNGKYGMRVGTYRPYDVEGFFVVEHNRMIGNQEAFRIGGAGNVFKGNEFIDVDTKYNVIAERIPHIIEE